MRVTVNEFNGHGHTGAEPGQDRVRDAANRLYAAECAFHDAHQSHVDAWILAAGNRLHDAVARHLAAVAAVPGSPAMVVAR